MRGDIGISTLIIFVVIVLIATVAAIVLLNAANSLKNQAQITQKESQAKFMRRLEITDVYGWVDTNSSSPTYGRIKIIGITARIPGGGTEYIDLRDTVLTFSTGNVIKSATFIDAGDADNETVGNPCDKTPDSVYNTIVNGVWKDLGKEDVYYKFMNGDYYTVSWIICKTDSPVVDDRIIFPGQIVRIYYAPPDGLLPGDRVDITFTISNGSSTSVDFTVPDVFEGSVVRLYPP